jgi:hypothetical protein
MKNKTALSLAAQEVLAATQFEIDAQEKASLIAAATLRAAVDKLSFQLPFEDSRCIAVLDLLSIADELEGVN